jgi:small subunit ribosomal protein S2
MAEALDIETLFAAGAHFGYSRTRRHPSAVKYIFTTKDQTDIFDLVQTEARAAAACAFVSELAQKGAQVLFVSGKNESLSIVRQAAERAGVPYTAGRWIGGTLTNFKNIRKRLSRLEKLLAEKESGELEKYTKKERLLLDREIEELEARFGGLVSMNDVPAALFVVDARHEITAVREANQLGIPVISLSSSDCDFALSQYPIPANDTSIKSVKLVVDAIADAYAKGKRSPVAVPEVAQTA